MKSGVISLSSYKTSILFIAGVPSGGTDERKTVRSILRFMSDTENDVNSDAEIIISEIKYDTENNEMSPFQKDIYDVIFYGVDLNDPEPDEEEVILYV